MLRRTEFLNVLLRCVKSIEAGLVKTTSSLLFVRNKACSFEHDVVAVKHRFMSRVRLLAGFHLPRTTAGKRIGPTLWERNVLDDGEAVLQFFACFGEHPHVRPLSGFVDAEHGLSPEGTALIILVPNDSAPGDAPLA